MLLLCLKKLGAQRYLLRVAAGSSGLLEPGRLRHPCLLLSTLAQPHAPLMTENTEVSTCYLVTSSKSICHTATLHPLWLRTGQCRPAPASRALTHHLFSVYKQVLQNNIVSNVFKRPEVLSKSRVKNQAPSLKPLPRPSVAGKAAVKL